MISLDLFSVTDVSKRLGVTPRQLQWWDEHKIVPASNRRSRSQPKIQRREYSLERAIQAGIAGKLVKRKSMGTMGAKLRQTLSRINAILDTEPPTRFLIVATTGKVHRAKTPPEVLARMNHMRCAAILIDVSEIRMKLGSLS